MFLSSRNDKHRPEDIQQLINSATGTPNCSSSPSAALPSDMESGSAGGGSASWSRASTSDQRAAHREEEEPDAVSSGHGDGTSLWSRFFSLPVLLLVGVTASLVILPLVLPPLPPPPSMLMLVPVAMLVLLLVLAFMPTSSSVVVVRGGTAGPTYM